jgi:glycosyltransferase involved in cell wall biosynthesis
VPADLIVFGEDWGGLPSSTQHLVRHLAASRRVLWVNSIGMRRPCLSGRDLRRLVQKARDVLIRPTTSDRRDRLHNLQVLPPFALPWPASRTAQRINRTTLGWQIRRALPRSGIARPILWISLPTAVAALDALEPRAVVYYCGDDFAALAGVDHAPVMRMERELVERADLILAASEVLAARFPSAKTMLVPHGVDLDLFSAPAPVADDLPMDASVAGFYGSLASWIDVEMLDSVARKWPNWQFVMIGPVTIDAARLRALPNVRFLGSRPHSMLPRYVQHWAVSILPFRDNAQVRACNPLKLREYLAAGTPVATTDFPALDGYRDLVEVAASPADFGAALQQAASDVGRNALRRARVSSEGWQARAQQVATALDAL